VVEKAPIARSPITPAPPVTVLAGWEASAKPSTAPLRLTDCTPCGKLLVRTGVRSATAHALGVNQGRARHDGSGRLVAGIGYEEWLITGPSGVTLPALARDGSDGTPKLVTIVDLTHARALVRIVGADSAKVSPSCAASTLATRRLLTAARCALQWPDSSPK
jgi:sarcosine oxidase gamma subunit